MTRSTQACFLTADRQCTELPLLRLPRLVLEVFGCDPCVPRDLAWVGWRGARCKGGRCKKPIPVVRPTPPHRAACDERPRLADSFSRLGQSGARGIPRVARPAGRGRRMNSFSHFVFYKFAERGVLHSSRDPKSVPRATTQRHAIRYQARREAAGAAFLHLPPSSEGMDVCVCICVSLTHTHSLTHSLTHGMDMKQRHELVN